MATRVVEAAPTRVSVGRRSWWQWQWRWRVSSSPWLVAALVLVVYGMWLLLFALQHGDPRDYIDIGRAFVGQSHASAAIGVDPTYRGYQRYGYDGQFSYYIALDPLKAYHYIDSPAYRYTRILYPLLARALALGNAGLIPYTLIAVNLFALVGGTFIVALWLKRKGVSPWLALALGLFPGLFFSLRYDLTEPLSLALVALAIYLFDFGGSRRLVWSAVCFALAALTRETVAIFAACYGLALLRVEGLTAREELGAFIHALRQPARWRTGATRALPALSFLGVALAPLMAWKLALALWFGSSGVPAIVLPEPVPLRGLTVYWPFSLTSEYGLILKYLVAPGVICGALAIWALARGTWTAALWALLLNVLLTVVFLNRLSYVAFSATGRIQSSVALAALFAIPSFKRFHRLAPYAIWLCALLWLIPMKAMYLAPALHGYQSILS